MFYMLNLATGNLFPEITLKLYEIHRIISKAIHIMYGLDYII